MGSAPTKAAGNMYCKCRMAAATSNDRLKSRESAAELLGLSPSTLADYELGLTKVVPVDKVVLMADLYHAPELRNWYCKNVCPLGEDLPAVEAQELDRIAVKAISAFRKLKPIEEKLIDITEDGIITDEEKPTLTEIISTLKKLTAVSQELTVWAEKHLNME